MCDDATYDALSLWKVFESTFFPKPLGRNFSEFADALREFVEGDQKDWGGLISPRMSKRQFKKQLEMLVDVAVAWVQRAAIATGQETQTADGAGASMQIAQRPD